MKYDEYRKCIEGKWLRAQSQGNKTKEALLVKVVYNLPENRPGEALVNMLLLVQRTRGGSLSRKYYLVLLQELGKCSEVRG